MRYWRSSSTPKFSFLSWLKDSKSSSSCVLSLRTRENIIAFQCFIPCHGRVVAFSPNQQYGFSQHIVPSMNMTYTLYNYRPSILGTLGISLYWRTVIHSEMPTALSSVHVYLPIHLAPPYIWHPHTFGTPTHLASPAHLAPPTHLDGRANLF